MSTGPTQPEPRPVEETGSSPSPQLSGISKYQQWENIYRISGSKSQYFEAQLKHLVDQRIETEEWKERWSYKELESKQLQERLGDKKEAYAALDQAYRDLSGVGWITTTLTVFGTILMTIGGGLISQQWFKTGWIVTLIGAILNIYSVIAFKLFPGLQTR